MGITPALLAALLCMRAALARSPVELAQTGTGIEDDASGASVGGSGASVAVCDPSEYTSSNLTTHAALRLASHVCPGAQQVKHFSGETLAYVTPWNSDGYEVCKQSGAKFTYIAPVWLQLRSSVGPDGSATATLTGTHDIDSAWMQAVTTNCRKSGAVTCPKIVPRVVWELPRVDKRIIKDAVALILRAIEEYHFDGITLEIPLVPDAFPLIKVLGKAIHHFRNGTFILVTPPAMMSAQGGSRQASAGLTFAAFKSLSTSVDRWSVMTYDYSVHRGSAGPNTPMAWVRDVIQSFARDAIDGREARLLSNKLLVGLPFYGYDNTDALVGRQWLELLAEHKPKLKHDKTSGEHYFTYTKGKLGYDCRAWRTLRRSDSACTEFTLSHVASARLTSAVLLAACHEHHTQ